MGDFDSTKKIEVGHKAEIVVFRTEDDGQGFNPECCL